MIKSDWKKIQAIILVFIMVASGLIVMGSYAPEAKGEDTYYNGTWVVASDYTIQTGDAVYVNDDNGNPNPFYPAHTGVVIGGQQPDQPVTLTVKGTLVVDEGNINVGQSGGVGQPLFGKLVVDGGTVKFNCPTVSYTINGNGAIEIVNGSTITNNGTGSGEYRFMANSSLTIKDSTIEHLANSGILTSIPELKVYTGGINIKYPREGDTSSLSYTIQNSTISNSKVGISFENFPGNKGYFEGITFNDVNIPLNFTGSAPYIYNGSFTGSWSQINIQDSYRESTIPGETNDSHPILVNCGYIDKGKVNISHAEGPPASTSTLNISAFVNVTVKNQAGGPVAGASVTMEDTHYDPQTGDHSANTFFTGTTNATGVAGWIPVTLYTIYGEFQPHNPPPPPFEWVMKNQTHGDWNTTGEIHNIFDTVHNVAGLNPIKMNTRNIFITLVLHPDLVAKNIYFSPPSPTAGDRVRVWGSLTNEGTMDAYCTISFYNDSIDDSHMFYRMTNAFVKADGRTWRTDLPGDGNRDIRWNTTRNMTGDHTLYMVISNVQFEQDTSNNQVAKAITLARPSPSINIAIFFSDSAPMDGDTITVSANLTNKGKADAGFVNVTFYDGDPANGGVQIGSYHNFTYLNISGTENRYKVVSVTWNTFNKANDSANNTTWGQNHLTHNIYVSVLYNNTADPNASHTLTKTGSAPIDVYKYYNVSFNPEVLSGYINKEKNWTIYTFYVKNTGRAVDNFTFTFDTSASNASNIDAWNYTFINITGADISGERIFLHPGASAAVYLNVTGNMSAINPGETFTVNVTAHSVNNASKTDVVSAMTSAGRVDYTPTGFTFRRADGVIARNQGNAQMPR